MTEIRPDAGPRLEFAQTSDGRQISWERLGTGPGLVVVHGGARSGKHYRVLAQALADRYSVILVDRRGRGQSAPMQPSDDLEREVGDLGAVLAATGAERVFGHSAGAVVALAAASRLPIRRLAVYEPPLLNDVGLPLEWVPAFESALRRGQTAKAFVLLARGLQMGAFPSWLPGRLLELPLRLLVRGPEGRELAQLLGTIPRDLGFARETHVAAFKAIACPTLVMSGTKSPAYLREAARLLGETLPDVTCRELPGVGHNAPDEEAPALVAQEMAAFF